MTAPKTLYYVAFSWQGPGDKRRRRISRVFFTKHHADTWVPAAALTNPEGQYERHSYTAPLDVGDVEVTNTP